MEVARRVVYSIPRSQVVTSHHAQVRFYTLRKSEPVDTVGISKQYSSLIEVSNVNSSFNRLPELPDHTGETGNHFWNYLQSLSPETIAQLSRPASLDVFQVMERNIIGMLGALPSEHFNVMITTSREDLGRLLASAMMSGYFIHNAEQRMMFEKSLAAVDSDTPADL